MKLVVGLGNPGKDYQNTRHNVGFMLVDRLKEFLLEENSVGSVSLSQSDFQLQDKFYSQVCKVGDVLLVKPQTFMNLSGRAVTALINFYKIDYSQLLVCHDDLDLALGKSRLELGRGPKVHNGVNSIEAQLGSKDFWRLRLGVDDRSPQDRKAMSGSAYVLKPVTDDESSLLSGMFDLACTQVVESFLKI